YDELEIDLELGDRVLDLGLRERTVLLESGKTIGWDLLCICTGSDARNLSGFEGAVHLRERPSTNRLRSMHGRAEALAIARTGCREGRGRGVCGWRRGTLLPSAVREAGSSRGLPECPAAGFRCRARDGRAL